MSNGARTAALAAALAASLAFGAAWAFDDEDEAGDEDAATEQAKPEAAQKEEEPYKRPAWLEKLDRFAGVLQEAGLLGGGDGAAGAEPKRGSWLEPFVIPEECITPDRRVRTDTERCALWNEALLHGCRDAREGLARPVWTMPTRECHELHQRISQMEAQRRDGK